MTHRQKGHAGWVWFWHVCVQMNSPRRLPLTGCGTVLQAACGGTQVAVLNGQCRQKRPLLLFRLIWGLMFGFRSDKVTWPHWSSDTFVTVSVADNNYQYLNVFLLLEKGEVFVWGYGILGKGPNLSESSTPELIPPTLFGRSEFSPSAPVSKIRCGLSHFAAVTGTFLSSERENRLISVCRVNINPSSSADVCFDPIKLDFYEGLKFKRERKVSQKRE